MNVEQLENLEEMLKYLESLRKTGIVNMYGASPYLEHDFCIDKRTAQAVLTYWMKNYNRLCEKYGWR